MKFWRDINDFIYQQGSKFISIIIINTIRALNDRFKFVGTLR